MTETSLTAALETVKQTPAQKNIRDLIEGNAVELAKKLPRGLEFEYFKQAVYSEIRRNPKLQECDPLSMLGAVVRALQLGLSPGTDLIYFLPFKKEVQVIVGYKGKIELGFRSGHVKDITSQRVFAGDDFHWREGTRPYLDHTSAGPPADRELTHVYAVARLRTGGAPFVVLYPEDIDEAIKNSPTGKKGMGPWVDFRPQMELKTAVHRLGKWLPQSPQLAASYRWDETAAPDPLDETSDVVIEG